MDELWNDELCVFKKSLFLIKVHSQVCKGERKKFFKQLELSWTVSVDVSWDTREA